MALTVMDRHAIGAQPTVTETDHLRFRVRGPSCLGGCARSLRRYERKETSDSLSLARFWYSDNAEKIIVAARAVLRAGRGKKPERLIDFSFCRFKEPIGKIPEETVQA